MNMKNQKLIINYQLKTMSYIMGNMLDNMDYDNEIQRWYGKDQGHYEEEEQQKNASEPAKLKAF